MSQNILQMVAAIFSVKNVANVKTFLITRLMPMVYFYTPFENFDFSCFEEGMKSIV